MGGGGGGGQGYLEAGALNLIEYYLPTGKFNGDNNTSLTLMDTHPWPLYLVIMLLTILGQFLNEGIPGHYSATITKLFFR